MSENYRRVSSMRFSDWLPGDPIFEFEGARNCRTLAHLKGGKTSGRIELSGVFLATIGMNFRVSTKSPLRLFFATWFHVSPRIPPPKMAVTFH